MRSKCKRKFEEETGNLDLYVALVWKCVGIILLSEHTEEPWEQSPEINRVLNARLRTLWQSRAMRNN